MSNTPQANAHILLVEDRRDIREPLKRYLEQFEFRVSEAADSEQARRLLMDAAPDLVVLDIMLPGEDGLSLCRYIQATQPLPIIFLTAMAEDTDCIVGLELGADDYLTKPFNPRELLARIRAVLRRSQQVNAATAIHELDASTSWAFADWVLNSERRELQHACGERQALSHGEYSILAVLLNRPQRVLNRDQLLDLTQGRFAEAFDRAVDNQISRLRRKLDCCEQRGRDIIQTVWGSGYKLAVTVSKHPQGTSRP